MPRVVAALVSSIVVAVTCGVLCGQKKEAVSKAKPPTRNSNYLRKEFKAKDGLKLVYYLMTPKDYDAKRKYPLVVALHGRGGSTTAADVLGRDKLREHYPCFVMAPMSPRPSSWASPKTSTRDIKKRPLKMAAVLQALKALQKQLAIDADRIYVTGQSMGGAGSFGAVAAQPDLFAAAVPVCGNWSPAEAKPMATVPFWIFHGAKDNVVPVSGSQEMVKALKAAGGKPKYTEYPGLRHNCWTKAYGGKKLWKWLFEQRRPSADKK
jgi:predicted peptidase